MAAIAGIIQQGMGIAGNVFDANASTADAGASKQLGYETSSANEDRIRRVNALRMGQQRAAAAQSGFDSSTGSFANLQAQSAGQAELDALTERYKGDLNAWKMDEQVARQRDKFGYVLDPVGHRSKAASVLFGAGISYGFGKTIRGIGG